MLKFLFNLTNPDGVIIKNSLNEYSDTYPEIITLCGEFTIIIDRNKFFYEPQFPILEFLFNVTKWIKEPQKKNMLYSSVETDDNPVISFVAVGDKWRISSEWQLFESEYLFTIEEIHSEINSLIIDLEKQISCFAS